MSVQRFFHRRLKIGGHRWLATVHESIVDPLDGGKEISYRASRKCALCGCIDKDWRVVDGTETHIARPSFNASERPAGWGMIGLLLKPLAIVVLLVLLVANAVSVSVGGVRGFFGAA